MKLEESPGKNLLYSQKGSWIKMKSGKYTFSFASPRYLACININKAWIGMHKVIWTYDFRKNCDYSSLSTKPFAPSLFNMLILLKYFSFIVLVFIQHYINMLI